MTIAVHVARSVPRGVGAVIHGVGTSGAVPRALGLSRAALAANGFEGKPGQTLVVPAADGPSHVAVGLGDTNSLDAAGLRSAAAAGLRAAGNRATIATTLVDATTLDASAAARAITEGLLLAAYKYQGLKTSPSSPLLTAVTLVVAEARLAKATAGAGAGQVTSGAAALARDLANTPPAHLTARVMAERAVAIAADSGLEVEVFNRDQLLAMGCGGMIGVNRGSVEPPRMVRLRYTPRNPKGHLALVGKGVMYDSGGISLKPSDGMHAQMKMDMSGAAAVLATMSALKALQCRTQVTAYLMCTDNMPAGNALRLGEVLTFRNGKTSEILNTDAEGRLILADGLSLAVEDGVDAIVDIATLTGSAMAALGTKMAALFANDDGLAGQVSAAAANTDERVWRMPLEHGYRKLIDSQVADMKNIGGPYGGAIIAALFLHEFVGTTPWAHIDMAGTMNSDSDEGWLSKGATGYGTRLLIDLATSFTPPTR
jgi:leucyl aminopeptidase